MIILLITAILATGLMFYMFRSDWVHEQHLRLIAHVGGKAREYLRRAGARGDIKAIDDLDAGEWLRIHYEDAYWSSNKMCLPWYWHIWDVERMRNYPCLIPEEEVTEEEWPNVIGG